MDIGLLHHDGESLVHQNSPANPATFLQVIAPHRDDIVVAVEWIFTGYWLADLGARAGIALVLGPALDMQAIQGGKAKNARSDAQKSAVLRRGGLRPQASGSPAARRAPRDLLRRRLPRMRTRAELLPHGQQTNRQDHVPALGKQLASKATRTGVAARVAAPAVHTSVAVDLALLDSYAQRRRDLELAMVQTATPHEANTLSVLQPVPGLGQLLSLVLWYELHDRARCPRVQDCVSSCRVGKGATASAGTRSGTAGTKSGKAALTWACSEAAVLCLRTNPAGQTSLTR